MKTCDAVDWSMDSKSDLRSPITHVLPFARMRSGERICGLVGY